MRASRRLLVWLVAVPLVALAASLGSAQTRAGPTKVSVGVPVPAVPFLPFYVSKQKGFDRANAVEISFQPIAGTLGVQAMIGGSLEFSLSAGSVLNARLAGAPVRVLMIMIDKSTYALYARPEIRSLQDLKGKTIAVDSVGGSQYSELRRALEKAGLSPGEVVIMGIPGPHQLAALESKGIAASVVAPPQDLRLEKLGAGYHRLLRLGEYVEGINGGLGVSASLLQSKPELVDGMVAAGLMGLRYLREHREGALPLIMSYLNVDARDAAFLYDSHVKAFSDGRSSPASRAEIIRVAAEALRSARPLDPTEVFDFRPLDRAQARLQATGWRPN